MNVKKVVFFLFLFLLFSFPKIRAKEVTIEKEEKVRVKISFLETSVTTRNLSAKLLNIPYTLKHANTKIKLSYLDDTIKNKIENLPFYNLSQLESDYEKVLKEYGLYTDIEKINVYGVLLSEVVIDTEEKYLETLKNLSYEVKKINLS